MTRIAKKVVSLLGETGRLIGNKRGIVGTASREGDQARDSRDWLGAVEHYRRHLERNPADAGIMVQLGHALKESGQLIAARTAYHQAVKLTPNDADLHLQIGHLAKIMGDQPAMLASYARAFELSPDQADPYKELLEFAPRTPAEWTEATTVRALTSPHNLQRPAEPQIRAHGLAAHTVEDAALAALDTVRIARIFRKTAPGTALTPVEQDYALMKMGVFNSTYEGSLNVFAALAGLSGIRQDQPVDVARTFALGAVPARRPGMDVPDQPNILLQNYQDRQIAASARLILRPELKGTVKGGPLISVLLPVYRGPAVYVERAILSVLMQTYQNVQLCVVDDFSQRSDITALLAYYAAQDPRVSLETHTANRGIAEATNTALRLARGEHIALLDHDDMIAHDAMALIAARLQSEPGIDLLYTDECKIDGNDIADEIFTKPDWSPSLLLSVMYTAHLSVYRKALVTQVGGFRSRFDFSQDYDLALRVAETNPHVVHLAECLYGWRMIAGSAAQGGKPMARMGNVAALQDAADRRHLDGQAIGLPLSNRIRHRRSSNPALVSLIIPSDNETNIAATVASVLLMTSYSRIEILVVANSDCAAACRRQFTSDTVRYVPYDKPYNFSDKCNVGAAAALGQYVVFFNDDVRVTDPDWLDVVLEVLSLPGVGIAGPKLLYENGAIQHGGMVTGVRGLVGTAFHTFPDTTNAHFGFAQCTREVSLICGACLAIKAEVFKAVGGFDAVNVPIAHSDVDLCFKVREAGLSCVYTPHTALTHIGHLSIGAAKKLQKRKPARKDKADLFLLRRWGAYCAYDPYFPPGMRDIAFIDSMEPYELHVGRRGAGDGGRDILIVSHDLSGSGAPKVAYDIAAHLRARGDYVLVVSPEDGPFRKRLLAIGADVLIDPLCTSGASPAFFSLASSFDAVIANTIVTWPVINQLAPTTRVFWYIHETMLIDHLARIHPELGREAKSATIWAGSRMAAEALRPLGVTATVIEYGVEPSRLAPDTARHDRIVVSVMATYEPRKGQDLALLAIQLLPKAVRDLCEFRFAGRINDPVFHSHLLDLDEDEFVQHLGTLTLEGYAENMAQSDIVLCPSRDDTLPLVSLDALANGKILVCSRAVGTSAYLRDRVSGYVPTTSGPGDIARALTIAITDRTRWPAIQAAARKVFEDNFTEARFRSRIDAQLAPETTEKASRALRNVTAPASSPAQPR